MLLPLTMLFGWPAIIGVTIGTFIGNTSPSGLGPVDWIGGSVANLVGCSLAFLAARRFKNHNPYRAFAIGGWIINLAVTLTVGTYILVFFPFLLEPLLPFFPLPLIVVSWLGIFLGSIIAINIAGTLLTAAIYRRSLFSPEIKRFLKI